MSLKSVVFVCLLSRLYITVDGICSNIPANWQPQDINSRAAAAPVIAYVKILEILSQKTETYGETYSVHVTLECNVRADRGVILPVDFNIDQMGAQPNSCPSRDVVVGNNYIVFLERSQPVPGTFRPLAVNQEECVFEDSWDNLQALSNEMKHCLVTDGCPYVPPGWKVIPENERAADAEIFVKAKVKSIHYTGTTTYLAVCELTCNMKQPANMQQLPTLFNVSSLGAAAGQCAEHHVTAGFEFYMFLERHFPFFPLPGATVPPHFLDNYLLAVQEVNLQQGVMNVTAKMNEIFEDFNQGCPNSAEVNYPLQNVLYALATFTLFFICS